MPRINTFAGTYEKMEEEEEEIYEVINIHKLKSAIPNLQVVNLYGINFLDDGHIEAFSSNCIQVGRSTFSISVQIELC